MISSLAKGRAVTTLECAAKKAPSTKAAIACPSSSAIPTGTSPAAGDIDALTSYVDFMPTLLDLCGVEVPADRTFHGQSLVPLLQGGDTSACTDRINVCDTQRVARPVKWRKSSVMKGQVASH